MPWDERTTMSERKKFIVAANQADRNLSQLCREYGISRKTGYKWLKRYEQEGVDGLADRLRCAKRCPHKTPREMERIVLELRKEHPAWGGRKLRARLLAIGHTEVPSASTITAILQRNNQIDLEESEKRLAPQRFEKAHPNEMWQIDFKGEFPIDGRDCHSLTVLDDHSRYLLGLYACENQQRETVQGHLTTVFRRYGLPDTILCDNGPPWGAFHHKQVRFTRLNVWWIRLGIRIFHSRPFHPQTVGKDERLHRTLNTEVIQAQSFNRFLDCQHIYDAWRQMYNHERPHEALQLSTPGEQYHRSPIQFPEKLPPVDYDFGVLTRRVSYGGRISFCGHNFRVGRAFTGYNVALEADQLLDGIYHIHFCKQRIKSISLMDKIQC